MLDLALTALRLPGGETTAAGLLEGLVCLSPPAWFGAALQTALAARDSPDGRDGVLRMLQRLPVGTLPAPVAVEAMSQVICQACHEATGVMLQRQLQACVRPLTGGLTSCFLLHAHLARSTDIIVEGVIHRCNMRMLIQRAYGQTGHRGAECRRPAPAACAVRAAAAAGAVERGADRHARDAD